jgi:hypothetical protein
LLARSMTILFLFIIAEFEEFSEHPLSSP